MKRFLTYLILITAAIPANAQLNGRYCESETFSGSCIEFLNGSEFSYSFSDCTSMGGGKGTYSLSGKTLTLTFTEPKPINQPCEIKIIEEGSQRNSVSFNIIVTDKKQGVPLPYGNPILVSSDGKTLGWSTTNEKGKCHFSVPASVDSATLKVSYLFYETCFIPVWLTKNYQLEIGLNPGPEEWIKPGTVWTWKLRSVSGKEFTLKGKPKTIYKKEL